MHYMGDAADGDHDPQPGFEALIAQLPDAAGDFDGTEFAQPAAMAYFGSPADIGRLKAAAEKRRAAAPAAMCETAMVMAEAIESAAADKDAYFITDSKTRGYVFTGAKWRAGWICILGGGDHTALIDQFKAREFLVFAQNGKDTEANDLGPRETAAVYFLQLMVRYAMVWGNIEAGNDHEMGHFLEIDLPGVVVAEGPLTPTEELLILALMKMGAPAVVPSNYPWDLGRQVQAEGIEAIVDAAVKFPNLREREIEGSIISLPDGCDPANAKEELNADLSIGGGDSFFLLKPGEADEGVDVHAGDNLKEAAAIGIMVTVGDSKLDVPTSKYLEDAAIGRINWIKGLRAERTEAGEFVIRYTAEAALLADQIAETVAVGLKHGFPYLENIHVSLVTEPEQLKSLKAEADAFAAERETAIAGESDAAAEYFHYCIECQPFSKEHVCVISPDRAPMCGRNPFQVRSAALFGATWHPFKRKGIEDGTLRGAIRKGEALDAETGEYASVNAAVEELSHGHVKRVRLHGVREFPHTNCGCFQFLAFWMEEPAGIGIMQRAYPHEAPGGITWDKLANAAGGKQAPGVVGVSRAYVQSDWFLKGDGGRAAVRWASPKAWDAIKDLVPDPDKVTVGE